MIDADLQSFQEVRDLMRQARVAARAFQQMEPKTAWSIAHVVGPALAPRARYYAERAVADTQIGRVEDKVLKNQIACERTLSEYGARPVGEVRRDPSRNLIEIGRPAGVVVALSNSTSPVATIFFKGLLALLSRNAIVISPHPVALQVCTEAVDEMCRLGVEAGAPANWIQIQRQPTLAATESMMRHEETDLIVATGGTPMVRAAYRSGNPTVGVGSGNTPVYVDRTADVAAAAAQLVAGKQFDHGSACTAPSVALVHADLGKSLLEAFGANGAHVCTPAQSEAVRETLYPRGGFNAKLVGRSPSTIAQAAGFEVSSDCRALICAFQPTADNPMFKEKLSPVLGLALVADIDEAIDMARWMLARGGAGHTSGIHSSCERQAAYWAGALDYYRVVVNGVTTNGATGTDTGLPYTFTVGTGYAGKSSLGVNMGIEPWLDYKRVAFPLSATSAQSAGDAGHVNSDQVRHLVKEELAAMRAQG